MFYKTSISVLAALIFTPFSIVSAHHSVLNYDGKVEVTVTGVVTSARFGYPHSIYRIDVTAGDGTIEKWILSTEDPRDARSLGFEDELKAIKVGDPITAVGWPDKFKKNTIRGHELHYPDGTVVMMRRGNYIWPRNMLAMDKMALKPENIPAGFPSTDTSLSAEEQVASWIDEDDMLTRMAREYADGRARLIGIQSAQAMEFPGVQDILECHTQRDAFVMPISIDAATGAERATLESGNDYISRYNSLLSRWWEQEHESCE